jgi:predicted oxidoreductase
VNERTVRADAYADCPFSIAQEYAVDFLALAERNGKPAEVRVPLRIFGFSLHHRVGLTFRVRSDGSEPGRSHDRLQISWTSGTALLPDFNGDLKFRIDAGATRILIEGRYRAPLGTLGRLVDASIGVHVAQASVNELAVRVATYLERRQREWLAQRPSLVPS